MENVNSEVNLIFCQHCDKYYKSKNSFSNHKSKCQKPAKENKCIKCDKIYNDNDILRRHIQYSDDPENLASVYCAVCDMIIRDKWTFNKHIETKRHVKNLESEQNQTERSDAEEIDLEPKPAELLSAGCELSNLQTQIVGNQREIESAVMGTGNAEKIEMEPR